MNELFLELDEWVNERTDPTPGYSITFKWADPTNGIERSYSLHDDATREAIELFVRRYKQPGPVFVSAFTDSTAGKPCVRLNVESSRATGFYNHCTSFKTPKTKPVPVLQHRRTDEGMTPAVAPPSAVGLAVCRRPAAVAPITAAPWVAVAADAALALLEEGAVRSKRLSSWQDWLAFKAESTSRNWVYFAKFGPEIFAWGTSSESGDRLRKTNLFHEELSGKYDRRVDYLMLKIIHGQPVTWVFEAEDAQALESRLKERVGNRYCFGGISAQDRKEISKAILKQFMGTSHWRQQRTDVQFLFGKFLDEIYFAGLSHPADPKRTFHFGDSLEPGFIERTLGRPDLIPAIEAVLKVHF